MIRFFASLPPHLLVRLSLAGAVGGVALCVFGEGVCEVIVGLFLATLGLWLWGDFTEGR